MSTQSANLKQIDCWLGLDIGGANIKVAAFSSSGQEAVESRSIPFALWKVPEQLGTMLAELLSSYHDRRIGVAVTMTGELADGYLNRKAGVESIVDAVEFAYANYARDKQVATVCPVYYGLGKHNRDHESEDRRWHNAESAKTNWNNIAAANWHAIASCLVYLPELEKPLNGFLIDIGSTTTDIIPIRNGLPATRGLTDLTRLHSRELFYAGVVRTPVCSLVKSLIIDKEPITIAREFFATIEDCFIVSGDVAEDKERFDTADGRPATRAFAGQRLAKMVCADAWFGSNEVRTQFGPQNSILGQDALSAIAQQVISAVRVGISDSIQHVVKKNPDLPLRFFLSGQGDWLAKRILADQLGSVAELHRIADYVGESNSQSMAAFAVACLATNDLSSLEPTSNWPVEFFGGGGAAAKIKSLERIRVIKIGGSLLSCADSPKNVLSWLKKQPEDCKNLWIVGGGGMVDQVRDYHAKFKLTESASHWLALDAMSLNLRLVQHWFPDWPTIDVYEEAKQYFRRPENENLLFDFGQWLKSRPLGAQQLPESWEISSDSCAAFLAEQIGATELVLLKSCTIAPGRSLEELAQAGIVDPSFPKYSSSVQHVHIVNVNSEIWTIANIAANFRH